MLFFKNDPIVEKDVFLVHVEEKPAFFAQVEYVVPDIKKGWWQVHFVILTVPLSTATWILDDNQIRGEDFTMKGVPMRIEKIVAPEEDDQIESPEDEEDETGTGATVVSLFGDDE